MQLPLCPGTNCDGELSAFNIKEGYLTCEDCNSTWMLDELQQMAERATKAADLLSRLIAASK